MEGYTNIVGNHKDFDNLDIEGRNNDDDDDDSDDISKDTDDRKRLLEIKVKLDGGGYGYVFAINKSTHVLRWNCQLCGESGVGHDRVDTHIQSKKHQVKMAMPSHPRARFTRKEGEAEGGDVPTLAPGEPIPPGFEDKLFMTRGMAQIQATLDRHKTSPLVGLEYLVELTPVERDNEPMYVCVLCEKRGDPRVAMAHITSYNHRSKYLGINFPKASRAIALALPRSKEGRKGNAEIVSKICSKVEEKHGRLLPLVLDAAVYEVKKDFYRQKLENDRHFRESVEENYMDIVNSLTTTYSINLDEVPLPTAEPEKKEDPKRKIGVDRSRLRAHSGKENDNKDTKKEADSTEKKSSGSNGKTKKGTRSNSLSSLTSISSSSLSRSPSPPRSRSRSKSRSRSYDRRRSRKRSEDRHGRRYRNRRRSRSRGRRSRSRSRHRSRNRSRTRSGSRGRYKKSQRMKRPRDPIAQEKENWKHFREELDKVEQKLTKSLKFHEKNPEKHPMYPEEWKKFWNRRYKELQACGQDPSKHDFKPEWIEFWNVRMKEMHEEELKKAKEELRQALNLPKEDKDPPLKRFLKRPPPRPIEIDDDIIVISPPTHGKDVRPSRKPKMRKRSPSPWDEEGYKVARTWPRPRVVNTEKERGHGYGGYHRPPEKPHYQEDDPVGQSEPVKVVTVLRLLTAMESQLGSMGPNINNLLASALAMEKTRSGLSESLLGNPDNLVIFDTVKEKLKGQLFAGIVEQGLMLATRSCIQNLAELLYRAEKMAQEAQEMVAPPVATKAPVVSIMLAAPEPIPVPGVGAMDKVAIAEQIAKALVAQGKTDVTQEQLEQLINAVVGMAHASSDMDTPITAAAFASLQQSQPPTTTEQKLKSKDVSPPPPPVVSPSPVSPPAISPPLILPAPKAPAAPIVDEKSPLERLLSVVHSKTTTTAVKPVPTVKPILAVKQMPLVKPRLTPLFPCVESITPKAPGAPTISSSPSKKRERDYESTLDTKKMTVSQMEDLNESDLKELLQNFSHLSTEEQYCLITYLKKLEAKEPDKVEKLRKFVNLSPNPAPVKKKPQSILIDDDEENEPVMNEESKVWKSGRLSPFSMRMGGGGANSLGGVNPSQDESYRLKLNIDNNSSKKIELDDSDDDYSFDDICVAASKKVKEKEKEDERARQAEEVARSLDFDIKPLSKLDEEEALKNSDHSAVLRETKLMVANIMGQIPLKLIQRKSPALVGVNPSTPTHAITTPTRPMITTPTKPLITTPTEDLPKKGPVGTNIDISNNLTDAQSSVNASIPASGINVIAGARPVPTFVSTKVNPSPTAAFPVPPGDYNNQYGQQTFHEDPQLGQDFVGGDRSQEPLQSYQGGFGDQYSYGAANFNGYYQGERYPQEQYPPQGGRYGPPDQRPVHPMYGGPPPQDRYPGPYGGPGPGYGQYSGQGYY